MSKYCIKISFTTNNGEEISQYLIPPLEISYFDKINIDKSREYITPYITPHISQFLSERNTGLGNALFQIASCIGLSHKLNKNIIFNNVYTYCKILEDRFNYNYKDTILRNIFKYYNLDLSFIKIYETSNYAKIYDTALIERLKTCNKNCVIDGYLENHNYFREIMPFISTLFQPDSDSLVKINKKWGYLLNDSSITTISLHFRGHEFITVHGYVYDYDYYNKAIEYITNNVENPYFLIFSDDKKSIDFNKLCVKNYSFIENEFDYLDLWTMSLCKHNILFTSTFSWWAAFLNNNPNKIVIANKKYNWDIMNLFTTI